MKKIFALKIFVNVQKKILMNGDVRDSFINLQYMLYETMDNEIWNMDIYHLLNNILKKYELVNL